MLEASSFDFRNRHPQHLLVKLAKHSGFERHSAITKTAYEISLDLYRTLAPLKQSTAAMAFTCLELSCRLHGQEMETIVSEREYSRWNVQRAMIMGMPPQKNLLYTRKHELRSSISLSLSIRHEPRSIIATIIRDVTIIIYMKQVLIFVFGRNPPRSPRLIHKLPTTNDSWSQILSRSIPRHQNQTQRRAVNLTTTTIHRTYRHIKSPSTTKQLCFESNKWCSTKSEWLER